MLVLVSNTLLFYLSIFIYVVNMYNKIAKKLFCILQATKAVRLTQKLKPSLMTANECVLAN